MCLLGVLVSLVFHLVTPAYFGAVGPIFTTVTLIVILFETGIGLRLRDLVRTMQPAQSVTG